MSEKRLSDDQTPPVAAAQLRIFLRLKDIECLAGGVHANPVVDKLIAALCVCDNSRETRVGTSSSYAPIMRGRSFSITLRCNALNALRRFTTPFCSPV